MNLIIPKTTFRCTVFSDVRGDFRLFLTLLTQIANVAKYDISTQTWTWNVTNTTLVCLGNFIDRYGKVGYNRLMITTEQAIREETKIIDALVQLQKLAKSEKSGNAVVVLLGDHELGHLMNDPNYSIFQMAKPGDIHDQKLRQDFLEQTLYPFCENCGVIAGWGLNGGTVYFSRGGFERAWFEKHQIKSIKDLNHRWKNGALSHRPLRILAETHSPIFSERMCIKPYQWRGTDEEFIVRLLGEDPNPKFVQSVCSTQMIENSTLDVHIQNSISPNYDGTDQIYYIHNCAADVFCSVIPENRIPQTLTFELTVDTNNEALYLTSRPNRMSDSEYKVYVEEKPHHFCPAPEKRIRPKKIQLSDHEILQLKPQLEDAVIVADGEATAHIVSASMILFSHDMKSILLLRKPVTIHQELWDIPTTDVKSNQALWSTLSQTVRNQTGINHIDSSWTGITVDLYEKHRIWVRRMNNNSDVAIDETLAQWISAEELWKEKRISHVTLTALCLLVRSNYMPKPKEYLNVCPHWCTQSEPIPRARILGWW